MRSQANEFAKMWIRSLSGHRSPVHTLSITVLLCIATHLHAAPPLRAELDGAFHEAVQEEVAVSGSVVVGVAAAGAQSGEATLKGLQIPALSETVCLTVLSRDGVYFSRNTYRMPAGTMGGAMVKVQLPYEGTRKRDLIRRYASGDLAVRATSGSCDQPQPLYLVPESEVGSSSLDVLINAFGANAVYSRLDDGAEVECVEFTEGRRTSYDYRCTIPRDENGEGRRQLVIERERYGRPLGDVIIDVHLGKTQ